METSFFIRVLLLLACQLAVKGFITRLPCIIHGKLNLVQSRYNSGSIIKHLTSLTQNECALACVTDELCVLANFKKDGTSCELISSTDVNETDSNEWNTLNSNTGSDKLVGPICEQINPCASEDYCRDVCDVNNQRTYVCLGSSSNAARKGVVSLSSKIPTESHNDWDLIDGDYNTIVHTNTGSTNWVKLDLGYVFRVKIIIIFNRIGSPERLVGYRLLIGTTDKETEKQIAILNSDIKQVFQCTDLVKYVFITKTPGDQYLNLSELEVYV